MTAAVAGTPLHVAYSFSYMRRGKAVAPPGKPGEEGGTASPSESTAATTATAPSQDPNSTTDKNNHHGGNHNPVHPYENSIKSICTVSTVESFWATYDYLRRPNDLPTTTDYHFFRDGIKPTWEDASNAKGGKWIVRLPKGLASRYWEEIILALIGGQFTGVPDGEVCGAVLSVRYSEDILGVWNRTADNETLVHRIRDAIKKVLQLPQHANIEYKPHQTSMQDRSSFRNTQVWKPKALDGSRDGGGRQTSVPETRRSSSWGEREDRKPKGRDMQRSWR